MKNRKYLISLVIPVMLVLLFFIFKVKTKSYVFNYCFLTSLAGALISAILIIVFKIELFKRINKELILVFFISGVYFMITEVLTFFAGGIIFAPFCALGTSIYMIMKTEKIPEKVVCVLLNPFVYSVFFVVDHALTVMMDFEKSFLKLVLSL